jgi:excisionase family DNA binding protein
LQAATVITAQGEDRKPEILMAMTLSVSSLTSDRFPQAGSAASDDRDLFTLPRAAQKLSVSKRTLERLIASGAFPPPVKIGRSSRVMRTDIANYLDQLCRQRGDCRGTS